MGLRDYGEDISCIDDIDASLTTVSGETCFGQALARRISCPRRGMFYDFDYGIDARRYMNRSFRPQVTSQAVEQECLKDERVDELRATVRFVETEDDESGAPPGTMRIELEVQGGNGPFDLTVAIDDLSVDIINESL
jgi:hypothetical protein